MSSFFNDAEVSAWLASRRNEYISTQEREKQTQTECTKEVKHTRTIGTQTEEEMTLDKNWHDKHNFGENISMGELHELINQDWPDEYYNRTTKEQGSILDQQTDTVILINVKKEKSRLLDDLLVRHPQLGKVINEGHKNKIYTLTLNSTLETDDGTTQETWSKVVKQRERNRKQFTVSKTFQYMDVELKLAFFLLFFSYFRVSGYFIVF